jgi:hypothetical protein
MEDIDNIGEEVLDQSSTDEGLEDELNPFTEKKIPRRQSRSKKQNRLKNTETESRRIDNEDLDRSSVDEGLEDELNPFTEKKKQTPRRQSRSKKKNTETRRRRVDDEDLDDNLAEEVNPSNPLRKSASNKQNRVRQKEPRSRQRRRKGNNDSDTDRDYRDRHKRELAGDNARHRMIRKRTMKLLAAGGGLVGSIGTVAALDRTAGNGFLSGMVKKAGLAACNQINGDAADFEVRMRDAGIHNKIPNRALFFAALSETLIPMAEFHKNAVTQVGKKYTESFQEFWKGMGRLDLGKLIADVTLASKSEDPINIEITTILREGVIEGVRQPRQQQNNSVGN